MLISVGKHSYSSGGCDGGSVVDTDYDDGSDGSDDGGGGGDGNNESVASLS